MTRRTNLVAGSLAAGLCLAIPVGIGQADAARPTAATSHATAPAKAVRTTGPAKATKKPKAPKGPKTPVATPTPSDTPSQDPSATPSATPSDTASGQPSSSTSPSSSAVALTAAQQLAAQVITDHLDPAATVTGVEPLSSDGLEGVIVHTDKDGANPSYVQVFWRPLDAQQALAAELSCGSSMFCGVNVLGSQVVTSTNLDDHQGYRASDMRHDGRDLEVTVFNQSADGFTNFWLPIAMGSQANGLYQDDRWTQVLTAIPATDYPVAATVTPASPQLTQDQVRSAADAVVRANLPAGTTVTGSTAEPWGEQLEVSRTTAEGTTSTGSLEVDYGQASWYSFHAKSRCSNAACQPVDLGSGLAYRLSTGTGLGLVQWRADGGAVAVTAEGDTASPLTEDELRTIVQADGWQRVVSSTPVTQPAA